MSTHPAKRAYAGEPTLGRVMRRPVWILALLFALTVAGVFAWLGQWQLDHAIQTEAASDADTETPRPLGELTEPGEAVTDAAAGMVVEVSGVFAPDDTRVIEQRVNDGETGAWVIGNFIVDGSDDAAHLAVAIGWASTAAEAARAAETLDADPFLVQPQSLEGRYMPAEGPEIPDPGDDPQLMSTMIPAQLVNAWDSVEGLAYAGFLVQHPGAGETVLNAETLAALQLEPIDSVPPLPQETINWLNLFYAVEWVVFGGFAVYFWFRLTRDAWEKEHELKRLSEAEAGPGEQDPEPAQQ